MKVSVFVPSFNQRNELVEAVDSVLAQTLPPHQIILVDDGSTDGSQDVILDYKRADPDLFTVVLHEKNLGVAQTRYDALECVSGEYVTYLDGDDWFLPTKLECESAALRAHPEASIAFSNTEYVSESGEVLWRWIEKQPPPTGDVFIETFARLYPKRSLFRMEMVKYSVWKEIGFHHSDLAVFEDYDMRIRLTDRARTVYSDEVLSRVRDHERGLSRTQLSIQLIMIDKIYRKNWPLVESRGDKAVGMVKDGIASWLCPRVLRALEMASDEGASDIVAQLTELRGTWCPERARFIEDLKRFMPTALQNTLRKVRDRLLS